MVVDVERFSAPVRTDLDQLAVRDGLYKTLVQAFEGSGIERESCHSAGRSGPEQKRLRKDADDHPGPWPALALAAAHWPGRLLAPHRRRENGRYGRIAPPCEAGAGFPV